MNSYAEKLKDPRWQKKRLEILQRDGWCCMMCFDTESTLHVHHRYYDSSPNPWDVPDEALVTLCEVCHSDETSARKKANQALIRAINTHFFAEDVQMLADAFAGMEPFHIPSVMAEVIVWQIAHQEDSGYWIDMEERRLAWEAENKTTNPNG